MIKVGVASSKDRAQIIEIAETMRANVADLGLHTITLEAIGETSRIDNLIELLRQFGIKEIVRTGKIAMEIETKEKPKTIKEEEE